MGFSEVSSEELIKKVADYIVEKSKSSVSLNKELIEKWKIEASERFGLARIPSNVELRKYVSDDRVKRILTLKPVRSISGVVIVAIMTYPFECPHGRCIYCPHYPGAPISYTGKEPSSMRGIANKFDPYLQIKSRVKQLEEMGHSTDKIELIIQGGTFNSTPMWYREWYMRRLIEFFIGYQPNDFNKGLREAEKSKYRIVGLTFETRPDNCSMEEIDWMLSHGATRVEIGVQTLYNDVYRFINRGHYLDSVIEATRRLKDAAFKVTYHIMPGLPKTSLKEDLQIFDKIFTSQNYLPDHIKIYPTLVLEHTGLIKLWREGYYTPIRNDEAVNLITVVKGNIIPPWNRIMRVNRDISSHEIVDGVNKPNLRQIIRRELRKIGLRCRCIRCREVGHKILSGVSSIGEPEIIIRSFNANDGLEIFISVEDTENDIIFGFLRLRKPSKYAWRPEIINNESYLVRELHIYGVSIPIGASPDDLTWQHRGLGRTLLKTAEDLVSSLGGDKIIVISGVGVREYYYKQGYSLDGPYVSKMIN